MFKLVGAFLCIFILIENSSVDCEVITYTPCSDNACELHEVRVVPCKEAENGGKKPCRSYQGKNITIEFDYTPFFDSERVLSQAYATISFIDVPMPGMDRDGCKFTKCPIKKGQKNVYRNAIYMSPAFPPAMYSVKYSLWDAENEANECCFTFKNKLTSAKSN